MNRNKLVCVMLVLMGLLMLLTIIGYFYYRATAPNMATMCVLAGALTLFNFLVALFLVNKNSKDKK